MKFRFSLGAIVALALIPFLTIASDATAQAPKNITMTVGVCDPAYGTRCIKPDTNGAIPITGSLTPSGTQDTNTKQVNGAAVNVGPGAAGTGTQRVTTSTDSTIATVGAVTAITNPLAPALAVPSTNASTTVTLGATYQTVFASSTARRGCAIQNPSTATEILSVRVKSVAVFTVPIGGSFNCGAPGDVVISDLIEVTAATTGHAFTAISQ